MKWWNFLNNNNISWTPTAHWIMMVFPAVGLFLIFMFRRPLSRINPKIRRFILGTLGGLIFSLEIIQDITKIFIRVGWENGNVAGAFKGMSLEMLELCRVNTLLLGLFLIFDKINWIKWIAATTLFGGWTTIFDDWKVGGMAPAWGVIKHGVVLTLVPALAITMLNEKFTLKNLGYAHLFNYVYVALVVTLNYTVPSADGGNRSIGNLNELELSDNPMVGWMPFGGRIFMYVFFITLLFWIWWSIENFILKHTNYARKINYLESFKFHFNQFKSKSRKRG